MPPRPILSLTLAASLWGAAGAGGAVAQSSQTYVYDAQGQVTTVSTSTGSVQSYRYDAAGNRSQILATDLDAMVQVWQAESLPHIIGMADADGWSGNPAPRIGLPDLRSLFHQGSDGRQCRDLRILIDSHTFADGGATIMVLDVFDSTAGQQIATRTLKRSDWTASMQYQDLTLPFTLTPERAGHAIELRPQYYASAHVPDRQHHGACRASRGKARRCITPWGSRTPMAGPSARPTAAGAMVYGPYVPLPAGDHLASYRLMIDSATFQDGGAPMLNLDVFDASAGVVLAQRTLRRADWTRSMQYEYFTLPFTVTPAQAGRFAGIPRRQPSGPTQAYVRLDRVAVIRARRGQAPPDRSDSLNPALSSRPQTRLSGLRQSRLLESRENTWTVAS